jgi:hypothetical protein
VRAPYAERVAALAEAHPDEPLLGPWSGTKNRINEAAARIERGRTTPTFSAARFRSTWLVDLCDDPAVPISSVMEAAGLKTLQSLQDLIPYLSHPDRAAAMRRLAGQTDV